jgi:hypothetical protein
VVSHDLADIAPLVDCAWRMKVGGSGSSRACALTTGNGSGGGHSTQLQQCEYAGSLSVCLVEPHFGSVG